MSEKLKRDLKRFEQIILDVIPIFFLIPLLMIVISYEVFPKPPTEVSKILIVVNTIFLAVALLDVIIFPRYDQWILLPILMSSSSLRELLIYWLVEPVLSVGISFLGLIISFVARSWTPTVPYVLLSYVCLIILAFKFRRHLEVLEERIEKIERRRSK
ncbi:MAG: hypothetical protein DRJ66_00965 [Thermoprotei archaeon]|nr:MAG: hypothetical protein DRJ66_00965 [Thermoprotei archaeon]RLF20287.1 MAG: hypothetical protein DRZ82_03025 [Thermoprotei archaeon]